jgi:ligand-binding SRPBCC domain-containing protein
MAIYELHHRQWVPHPPQDVFKFFSAAENLERLTPAFLRFQITRIPPRLEPGALIEYKLHVHSFPIRWVTLIDKWDPPFMFVDVQQKGPYKLWVHTHRFWPENDGTQIEDYVRYSLPFGIFGRAVQTLMVRRDVEMIFKYREQKIREIFP